MIVSDIRFELLMDAGNGAQKSGDILIHALAESGRYVFIEPVIPAEISPPKRTPYSMSGVVIRLSSSEIYNIGDWSTAMICEHEILFNRRLDDKEYAKKALVLLDCGNRKRAEDDYKQVIERANTLDLNVVEFDIDDDSQALIKSLNGNGKNMFYLGLLVGLFAIPKKDVEATIRKVFKKLPSEKLEKNLQIFANGCECFSDFGLEGYVVPILEDTSSKQRMLLDGNTAISMGLIDAGVKFFSGYPITPASTIMHGLAKKFNLYGGSLHQAEDEIAAIGAAIGAYYSGVPSATATSGPGLSLKQEFIGFAQVAEIPIIVIDVQRGGPSTGLPTRTEQSDLFAAIFGSHGDSTKVVLSVSSVEDCFYAPHVARYLTETLRTPVFILSDYLTSVSYKVFERLDLCMMDSVENIPSHVLERFGLMRLKGVEMVKLNQSDPGDFEHMHRVTGLNTDSGGNVEYSSVSNELSHEIRNKKIQAVREAAIIPPLMGDSEGDVLVIGWGSTGGVLKESIDRCIEEGLSVSALHFKCVYPLPLGLKDVLSKFDHVITAEVVYGDDFKKTPFSMMLRSETLVDVKCAIAQATGRPLKPAHVVSTVKNLLGKN